MGAPTKKIGKLSKKQLVFMGYVHMKVKSKEFFTKTDRGSPTKKVGKSRQKQLVFMKGNMCQWKNKVRIFD